MQNEYIEQKVTKPQAFFMLILGIVLVVVGFLVTEDADAVILLSVGALLSVIAVVFGTKYSDIQSTIITLVKKHDYADSDYFFLSV